MRGPANCMQFSFLAPWCRLQSADSEGFLQDSRKVRYKYPKLYNFSYCVYYTGREHSVCHLVRRYPVMVIGPLRAVTTITEYYISAGIFNCLATLDFQFPFASRLHALCEIMLNILDRAFFCSTSVPVQNVRAEFFCPDGRFLWCRGWWILVQSKISTANFFATQNHLHTSRFPIFTNSKTIPCALTDPLVAARN